MFIQIETSAKVFWQENSFYRKFLERKSVKWVAYDESKAFIEVNWNKWETVLSPSCLQRKYYFNVLLHAT